MSCADLGDRFAPVRSCGSRNNSQAEALHQTACRESGLPDVKIAGSSPFNGSNPFGSGTSERARLAIASAGSSQSTGQGASRRKHWP